MKDMGKNLVRWIVSFIFVLFAIVSLTNGFKGFIAALIFLVVAIFVSPKFKSFLKQKGISLKKSITVGISTVGLIVGSILFPSDTTTVTEPIAEAQEVGDRSIPATDENDVEELSEIAVVDNSLEKDSEEVSINDNETEKVMTTDITSEVDSDFSFTNLSETKYAKSSVNVRNNPDSSGSRLGGLTQNQEVEVTGICNETGWYRIVFQGADGFVSGSYLVDEPISVVEPIQEVAVAEVASEVAVAETVPEPQPVEQPPVEEKTVESQVPSNNSDGGTHENAQLGETVWVSKSGKKYHCTPDCSGMKNPTAMTLGDAINKGKEPCGTCVLK